MILINRIDAYYDERWDDMSDEADTRNQPKREMQMSTQRIARMIEANVAAVDSGRITWQQFGIVNRATWELADRGELCIIGSPASRRVRAVHRALAKAKGEA